jgi:hypothetical protein
VAEFWRRFERPVLADCSLTPGQRKRGHTGCRDFSKAATQAQELVVELRQGTLMVKVSWPITAASECAVSMRELLR